MTINDEIVILANQLANQGKKPTVALIKAKLTNSAPLPTIISTLKSWQHDPKLIALPKEKNAGSVKHENNSSETEKLHELLNEELAQMKEEISELKQLIHQLIAQQQK